jgi:hypothetical protein
MFLPNRLFAAVLAATAIASAQRPLTIPEPVKHPRLIALDSHIEYLREILRSDVKARAIYDAVREDADRLVKNTETVKYELIGPRLLTQSRRAVDRIYTLCLLFRLSGEPAYRERALLELRAAAAFPDWNPSHFLDTAEMTHAFAIGYDWLYFSLSEEDRAWIRRAIVEKGIQPALGIYREQRWWAVAKHNWNQVCNGGIGLGALAILESEPELSREVLRYALDSLPRAMKSYAPDGGWAEGPGYWHYATRYNVYFLAGLETALGTDFGLSEMPGFNRAGHFRVYFSGPSHKTFNYADGGEELGTAHEMFWLAQRFQEPVYAWHEDQQIERTGRADALHLVWFQQKRTSPQQAGWPRNAHFQGTQTVFLRNGWDGGRRVFAAVKGGDNAANHSHLDLGTFVLDYAGERFATDLGADDYNLPQYFGKLRWTYYRNRTEAHNVVLLNGENQDTRATAPITAFDEQEGETTIDLTKAYPSLLNLHTRRVKLSADGALTLTDKLSAKQPVEPLWGMVTEAEVALEGRRARFSRGGHTMMAEIRSPESARFDTVSTQPAAPQRQNEGTRKLVVRVPGPVTETTIEVVIRPAE